jgi:2-polyprenyl-6-methoxyphenol hydroxylase-like FAD-dependent oxidoreductase
VIRTDNAINGTDADVLIVGAGPVGTTLAIDLARRGVSVRIIDRAAGGFDGSRAKGIQPRTLEVFDDLGIIDDVLAGGSRFPLMGIHFRPITVPWRMLRSPHAHDDGVPYAHTWLIPQLRTDRALHHRLGESGVTVEYNCEIVEITLTADNVTARITTPNGAESITTRYVVGADGGASAVRKMAGIGFVGSTDESDRMLIVDACVSGGLGRDRWHIWPRRRGFIGACPLPHGSQFQLMIRLEPDARPPADEKEITRYIRKGAGNKRLTVHDVTWKSVFRPNIRLADAFRKGPVLLAGDAAHAHTPAGAQGLNTGVQDSYNLGWKPAQVLAGAPADLLDTYEAERQPIAAGVLGLSTRKYKGFSKLHPSSIKRGKDEQQLAITYRGGPLAPVTAERTSALAVGDRAPDAELHRKSTPIHLFDLYRGPHFTALAFGPTAARQLDLLAWPTKGAELLRIAVDAPDHEPEHVHQSLLDDAGNFRKSYGLDRDTILLIRPDGYTASIATKDMLNTITTAAAALTPPSTAN